MRRLDAELVSRGLARSRADAHSLILESRVLVEGLPALKPARMVSDQISIKIVGVEKTYVSRGAYKLIGALDTFNLDLTDHIVLDAGASTGGFTEVALERGAAKVISVDVGYGQLAWSLRSNPAVVVMERINIRNVVPADLPYLPTFVVADLSFISLKTVLPALSQLIDPEGQMVLMVKPQFEAGKVIVSANHGVIRDPRVRASSVHSVALVAMELGWSVAGVAASPLPGPKGNVEYFLWLTHTNATSTLPPDSNAQQLEQWIDHVVEKGPQ